MKQENILFEKLYEKVRNTELMLFKEQTLLLKPLLQTGFNFSLLSPFPAVFHPSMHWLLRNIDTKAMASKKIDLNRDFAASVYLFEAQNPTPPPFTLYTCIHTYSHREGGEGGRVEPEKGLEGQQSKKAG